MPLLDGDDGDGDRDITWALLMLQGRGFRPVELIDRRAWWGWWQHLPTMLEMFVAPR